MNTRLTIDIGNTATKLELWRGDEPIRSASTGAPDAAAIARFVGGEPIEAGIVCSVRGIPSEGFCGEIERLIAPLTVFTPLTPSPLVNAYSTPATLGADRLAAAVGAATLVPGRPLLVADLGTAATFDHVTADGVYTGGNIAPGMRMRLEALGAGTSQLPALTLPSPAEMAEMKRPFGSSTASAIILGAIEGVVAELTYYHSLLPEGAVAVITGGDAPLAAPLLNFDAVTDEHLVGRGLNRILSLQ